VERRRPHPDRIAEAVALLKAAKRPIVIAGGGVIYSDAKAELQTFAETFGIPVGETMGGKGAIAGESAMALGGYGVTGTGSAGQLMSQADLVIAVGTRLTDFSTGSRSVFNNPDVKFININVTGHDAYKQGALPLVADAREALRTFVQEAVAAEIRPDPAYLEEVGVAKMDWQELLSTEVYVEHAGEAMSQLLAVNVINQALQPGDTIVAAAGGAPGDLHQLWDTSGGRNCHLEFGFSCMGYEIPGGIGVRMAQSDGEVYVFVGDGTYLMNPTELVTAMQENLKITVIIAENHGYQIIRRLQMGRAGISIGNEFRARDAQTNRLEGDYLSIDFVKNAESMGARAWHVTTPDELRRAFEEARTETRSCAIVMEVEKHRYGPASEIWWDVAPAEVTNREVTQSLRAEYESDRQQLQRVHY
jgi:3D-(3,5/4)-trihydroxycyclohexane-1,2-dione acylhydrolase (decyclizing)